MSNPLPTFQPADDNNTSDTGFGILKTASGCLPLTDMNVSADIRGLTYQADVTQTFVNTLDSPLEATYIFPLPDRAAVTSFEFCVRDRVIQGVLKERGQARQEYQQAIAQGKQAAMAEEDRSGVFTMQVGNLPPGETATVRLKMVGPLELSSGEAEFRFPLVVAPRYTEGAALPGASVGQGTATDTDRVPDASRITPPVLLAGLPNPVRLSLDVKIDQTGRPPGAGWKQQVRSSLHTLVVQDEGPLKVSLQPGERLNRDFILRIPACRPEVTASLQLTPASRDTAGVMALTLTPPELPPTGTPPRDVVFLLDRSGSMGGWKMVAARRALARMVDALGDDDRFCVLAFDHRLEHPSATQDEKHEPVLTSAGNRHRWRTLEWLGKIEARGGTEMSIALTTGLDLLKATDNERRPIIVLVTDGQVSGEDMLLKTLASSSVSPRVYALGIDRAVNAGFLRKLAATTGGQADFVESEDRLDEAMDAMHRQLGAPVLTDVKIEPIDIDTVAGSQAPVRTPDLFPHRAVTVYARHLNECAARLRMTATTSSGEPWSCEVQATAQPDPSLIHFWGRQKVRQLEDEYATTREDSLREKIVSTSLESGVLSRFTAFVAVDQNEVVNPGSHNQQIVQPVEQVDGWGAGMMRAAAPMAAGSVSRGGVFQKKTRGRFSVDSMLADFDGDEPVEEVTLDDASELPPPAVKFSPPAKPAASPVRRESGRTATKSGRRKEPAWRTTAQRLVELFAAHSEKHFRNRDNWNEVLPLLHKLVKQLSNAKHLAADELRKVVSCFDTSLDSHAKDAFDGGEQFAAITQLLAKLLLPEEARSEFWK